MLNPRSLFVVVVTCYALAITACGGDSGTNSLPEENPTQVGYPSGGFIDTDSEEGAQGNKEDKENNEDSGSSIAKEKVEFSVSQKEGNVKITRTFRHYKESMTPELCTVDKKGNLVVQAWGLDADKNTKLKMISTLTLFIPNHSVPTKNVYDHIAIVGLENSTQAPVDFMYRTVVNGNIETYEHALDKDAGLSSCGYNIDRSGHKYHIGFECGLNTVKEKSQDISVGSGSIQGSVHCQVK